MSVAAQSRQMDVKEGQGVGERSEGGWENEILNYVAGRTRPEVSEI